jgi:hypothetical protein
MLALPELVKPGAAATNRRFFASGRRNLKWRLADAEIVVDGRRILRDVGRAGGSVVPTVMPQPLLQRFRARDVHQPTPSAT